MRYKCNCIIGYQEIDYEGDFPVYKSNYIEFFTNKGLWSRYCRINNIHMYKFCPKCGKKINLFNIRKEYYR